MHQHYRYNWYLFMKRSQRAPRVLPNTWAERRAYKRGYQARMDKLTPDKNPLPFPHHRAWYQGWHAADIDCWYRRCLARTWFPSPPRVDQLNNPHRYLPYYK